MNTWWSHASNSFQVRWLRGVIPIFISWALLRSRCAARMEGLNFDWKNVIGMVKGFILESSGMVRKFKRLGPHDASILANLNCPMVALESRTPRYNAWELPENGMVKLNVDRDSCDKSSRY